MLNKEEFEALGTTGQLYAIYDELVNPPDKINHEAEQDDEAAEDKVKVPPGFLSVFPGTPEPATDQDRLLFLYRIERFEGLIDIESDAAYESKKEMSTAPNCDLGAPIAYRYDGQERITFEKKPGFFRPLNWYKDSYNTLLHIARKA